MADDFIGFRVTPDVKAKLEAEALEQMRPLSHLIRDRVVKPLETKEERSQAIARMRRAIEEEEVPRSEPFEQTGMDKIVGDAAHQQECIERYDNIIACLRAGGKDQ